MVNTLAKGFAVSLLVVTIAPVAVCADPGKNLLSNGGLEQDTDGDGVPDGWISHPHHFSSYKCSHKLVYLYLGT